MIKFNRTFQISHYPVVRGLQETFLIPRMYQVDLYICLLHTSLVKIEYQRIVSTSPRTQSTSPPIIIRVSPSFVRTTLHH
jgi:hypothetical protein